MSRSSSRSLPALLVAASLVSATGCKFRKYDVTVHFTPTEADRRLAKGQSDVVTGRLDRADGQNVYITSGGMSEPIPLSEIAEVEQKAAKRDVSFGQLAVVGGGVLALVGALSFECGQNEFPVFCSFSSERNFFAGLAFLGGIVIIGGGVGAIFSGKADQSRNARLLRGSSVKTSSWWVLPAPIAATSGAAPGLAAGVRF